MYGVRDREYREMTVEELEQRLRETFFYTDEIDESVYLELERLRAALEEKDPRAFSPTAEEFWERFRREHGEELDRCRAGAAGNTAARKPARRRGLMRSVLIAAVVMVLLAGAALAADSFGLWAWVPRWDAAAGRFVPAGGEAAGGSPIRTALAELGIDEPVYPAYLPAGFVLTESHISEEPLMLIEQYARGSLRLSITVTSVKGVRSAVYQAGGTAPWERQTGKTVHYLFRNEETIIAVRYTEHYAATVSGNLPLEEMESIMDSIGTP